jgi:hypothetical protein
MSVETLARAVKPAVALLSLVALPSASAARPRCSRAELRLARGAPKLLAAQWATKAGAVRALEGLRAYSVEKLAPDRRHREVYLAYRRCHGVAKLWRAVVKSTSLGRCDMKVYRRAIHAALEQGRQDRSSIRQALYYWRRRPPSKSCHGPNCWWEETRAMMYLLSGQKEDREMMNIYKACFRDHGGILFEAIAKRRRRR